MATENKEFFHSVFRALPTLARIAAGHELYMMPFEGPGAAKDDLCWTSRLVAASIDRQTDRQTATRMF